MKYIPFLFIIFVIACEQVVEIDIPEHESQLVLSSFYKAGDTKITAHLTKSLAINSNEDLDDISGATIKFYENDVLVGQLEEGADTSYYPVPTGELDDEGNPIVEYLINRITYNYGLELSSPLEQEKTYKITAEAPNYKSVSATQKAPVPANVNGVEYLPMSRPGLEGYVMDALKIQLQDTPGSDEYYEFKVFRSYQNTSWGYTWIESITPGVEQGRSGTVYLTDNLFEGSTYDVELLVWPEDTTQIDFRIEINSITRDKYLFFKSLKAYEDALYNPFAEPVIVHTNVEDGQGVFSMENKTEVLVE